MLRFCTENAQATAMGVLLGTAALVALVLATRGGGSGEIDLKYSESEDISSKADVFTTHRLPMDARFMPSIGNGHVSTNIFSDTVYMNGLYSGRRGESHRARIPAWCNVRLNSTLANQPYSPVYTLDTTTGAFEAFVDREMSVVRHRIYAHKFYTRAIVNQILISAKPHLDPNFNHQVRRVHLTFNPGPESSDITFKDRREVFLINRRIWTTCGLTKESEDLAYQKTATKVCAYWTAVPDHLIVPRHDTKVHTFVMTADKNETVARLEMEKVLQESEYKLFHKHKIEWSNLLNKSRFHIEGNLKLAKIVNGIWYYILSSLPSEKTHQKQDLYYGLSPGSLARGGLLEDYEGHNFWDTEIWMFPSILMLHPKLAQKLLQYRIEMATVAANLAKHTGHKGIRFPWESAFTGQEVTQPCCPDVAEFEHHITGSIAFAARQYLAVTRDEKWLKNGGCSLVTKMADFWSSRVTYNDSTGFYDINNVMGPDEDHSNISNSVFTNVVAGYSLYLAQYVACLCRSFYLTDNPDEWADIAWNLALPYDKAEDYHPQFSGYKRSYKIKQADAVLLGFPLQYPMKGSTRANDLTFYETMTRASGPAMTWSMHTIGHLALGNNLRAAYLFNRSFVEFVREPFKVWSELKRPNVGCVNFLTGMGGFLQSLLFGYAGVSIHLDRLEIRKPQLPPEATRFQIKGLSYLGSAMILDITLKSTILQVLSTDKELPLVITIDNEKTELEKGLKVILEGNGPFIIKTMRKDHNCPLPQDLIGQTGARPANRRKDYTGF